MISSKNNINKLIAPDTLISQVIRDCVLLFVLPIDFLLTYGDPLEKIAEITECNEKAHTLGQKLLRILKKQVSGRMRVYFVGSNFFKLPGIDDDIDFLVEYATDKEKEKWKQILTSLFGNPVVENYKFVKWESEYDGFAVEVLLSNPNFRIFRKMYSSYKILYAHPEIRDEYEKLKRNSVGVTIREYNRRQLYFFDYFIKK